MKNVFKKFGFTLAEVLIAVGIIGTIAAVCGASFYIRNREAAGRIRLYIFSYGISAAMWCIFFGCIGFCEDFDTCYVLRKTEGRAVQIQGQRFR